MESQVPSPNTLQDLDKPQRSSKRGVAQQIALPSLFLLLMVLAQISCKKTNSDINQRQVVPTITSIKPQSAKSGDTIIIIGTNFNLNPSMDTVKFNGITVRVQKASSDTLYVIVPPGNCSGTVSVNGIASPGPVFTVLPAGINFSITGVKPLSAKPGDTILIIGTNFNLNPTMDTVRFNGIPAQVEKAKSDTLFVIVPTGNANGVVTVNGISAPGPVFKILQNGITSVQPAWGKQGDTILIIGTNFNPNPAKDFVTINGVTALVIKASADTLYVIVPFTSTGAIIVNGITAPAPGFIYAPSVLVTTVAGGGTNSQGGDLDGPDSLATFYQTTGLCIDKQGNLFISEHEGNCVRKISAGSVSTFLGTRTGTSVTDSSLRQLDGIAMNAQGDMYVTEGLAALDLVDYYGYHSPVATSYVLKISNGIVSTLDGGYNVGAMAFDFQGNLYVAESGAIRKITPSGGPNTFAGKVARFGIVYLDSPYRYNYQWTLNNGYQDGQDTAARFGDIVGLASDADGNIYASDMGCSCIRKITPSGLVTYFALGSPTYNPYPYGPSLISPPYTGPVGICADGAGNLFVTEGNSIVKITPGGAITTVAGSNTAGYADGPATIAQFNNPNALALDAQGNLYVSDVGNNRIRKITFQ